MSENDKFYDRRLGMIEDDLKELFGQQKETQEYLKKLADNMALLTQVVTRQEQDRKDLDRLYGDHRDIAKRVQVIEVALPPLVESRAWVVKWVVGIVSLVIAAVVAVDIHKIIGGSK